MHMPSFRFKESEEEKYKRKVRVSLLKASHLSQRMSHFIKGLSGEKFKQQDKETIIKKLLEFMEVKDLPYTNKTNL